MESLNILEAQNEASKEEKQPEVKALASSVDLEAARIRIEKLESVLAVVKDRAADSEEGQIEEEKTCFPRKTPEEARQAQSASRRWFCRLHREKRRSSSGRTKS